MHILGLIFLFSRDLMAYVGCDAGSVVDIVTKLKNGEKTIIASPQMVSFEQCYIEKIIKNGRQFVLLTEK